MYIPIRHLRLILLSFSGVMLGVAFSCLGVPDLPQGPLAALFFISFVNVVLWGVLPWYCPDIMKDREEDEEDVEDEEGDI